MDKSPKRWYRSSPFLASAAIVTSWLARLFGPLSILMPFIVGGGLLVLLRRRHLVSAAFLLCLMPLTVVAMLSAVEYAAGEPQLVYPGLPWTETHNPDRELRCARGSSGCIVSGNEWAVLGTHNLIVRGLTRVFGPVRGSYLGPYPTHEEATAALATGERIAVDDIKQNRVTIAGTAIPLDEGVGRELVETLAGHWIVFSEDRIEPIVGTIFEDECVILRIPTPSRSDDSEPSGVIVLISRSAGRPFAYYGEGSYYHHVPPVPRKRPDS